MVLPTLSGPLLSGITVEHSSSSGMAVEFGVHYILANIIHRIFPTSSLMTEVI
jgi:hypothetical protein